MSVGCGGRNGEELIDIDAMIAFYLDRAKLKPFCQGYFRYKNFEYHDKKKAFVQFF
jgi:hypothetical protein